MEIIYINQIQNIILDRIVHQEFKPGMRLSIESITEEFNVSRTPVREALKAIEKDGLIEIIPRQGFYVKKFSRKEFEEIYQIREALEGLAIKLAVDHLKDDDIQTIQNVFTQAEQSVSKGESKLAIEADTYLHDFIVTRCQNQKLIELLEKIHDQIVTFRTWESEKFYDRMFTSFKEHQEIIEALKKKDAELAEKLMMEHIKRVGNGLLELYPFEEDNK